MLEDIERFATIVVPVVDVDRADRFASFRSCVRPMPKLFKPPVLTPIFFQFSIPRSFRFSFNNSMT